MRFFFFHFNLNLSSDDLKRREKKFNKFDKTHTKNTNNGVRKVKGPNAKTKSYRFNGVHF